MTMQVRVHAKKTFLPMFERFEPLILDSTAITTYMTCARKYFYRHVLGFSDRAIPIYFVFGSAYHKFWDTLVKHRTSATSDQQLFTIASIAGLTYFSAHASGVELNAKFDYLTVQRLLLSMKVAFEFYLKEKTRPDFEILAAEQIITTTLPDGNEAGGRGDQIVRWNSSLWGRDHKTTSKKLDYYDRTMIPNDQFTGYTYIESKIHGEQVKGQLVLVLHNSKNEGPILKQFMTTRSQWELAKWEQERMHWHKLMAMSRDADIWAQTATACTYCQFRKACSQGSEIQIADTLKAMFKIKVWDFTNIDGEDD